jgi:transcriptional regulator with XRE-family HTH domain
MPRQLPAFFPAQQRQLAALGDRLRLARKRRRLSTVLMAERVGVSRDTFNRVEKGDPAVSLGIYLRVLRVLNLDSDLDLLAKDDALGRKLQDLQLDYPVRQRPTKRQPRKE